MPITPTYPGVYVEEIPSGVRTIIGGSTSITSFIGRALKGPVDEPVTINSFAEFERIFGGLWLESSMSYAVRDFYLNGGSQAIIVRLFHDYSEKTKAPLNIHGMPLLEAANPGSWGNNLRARVDHDVLKDIADSYGLTKSDLFNLTVCDTKTGVIERFPNLTVKDSPCRIDKVLEDESKLVRVSKLPENVPEKHENAIDIKTIWKEDKYSNKVEEGDRVSDGKPLNREDFTGEGKAEAKKGLYSLEKADIFNLLCIPPYIIDNDIDSTLIGIAAEYCEKRRAMLIVDPPSKWIDKKTAKEEFTNPDRDSIGTRSTHAAIFFPRLKQPNPLRNDQMERFVPCGAVAGVFARTDMQRGIWKAPAGNEASLKGVPELSVSLTDDENGELNMLGINCLRAMPAVGRVIWGSRTLKGDDRLTSEWKYIPVRRLANYIEENLYRGTKWIIFEPNDEPLWAQIRLNIGAFMHDLFRQGAFQGKTPREAYFVKCDKETTNPNDINKGIVNIFVGFAPLKPAEFVMIKIQQMAGQIQT